MATNNTKNQLALDLGDTVAKLSVRDLIVRGEIETPRASAHRPKAVPLLTLSYAAMRYPLQLGQPFWATRSTFAQPRLTHDASRDFLFDVV
jgi:hypothetical protein